MGDFAPTSGGDSGSGSQSGSQGTQSAGQTPQSGTQAGGTAPTVYELTHDSLVRLPGAKEPVKWGEHNRGFQAEFTKTRQTAAQLQKQLQQVQQELQRRDQAARLQQQSGQPDPRQEFLSKLKALQYLNGEDAAALYENLHGNLGRYDQELQKRDMALALLYRRLQAVEQIAQTQQGRYGQAEFDRKIAGWVKELDLPEEANQLAKEIYLAYEGDDLDNEFPRILKERWEQAERIARTRISRQAQQARQAPFLPGKGGQGSAGGPLKDLKRASSAQVADKLFAMVGSEVET